MLSERRCLFRRRARSLCSASVLKVASRARGISIAYYQRARRAGYAHQWMTGHRCMTAGSTFYYFCGHVSRRAISSARKWKYDTTPPDRGRNRDEAERKGAISCVRTSGKSPSLSAFKAVRFCSFHDSRKVGQNIPHVVRTHAAANAARNARVLPLTLRLPAKHLRANKTPTKRPCEWIALPLAGFSRSEFASSHRFFDSLFVHGESSDKAATRAVNAKREARFSHFPIFRKSWQPVLEIFVREHSVKRTQDAAAGRYRSLRKMRAIKRDWSRWRYINRSKFRVGEVWTPMHQEISRVEDWRVSYPRRFYETETETDFSQETVALANNNRSVVNLNVLRVAPWSLGLAELVANCRQSFRRRARISSIDRLDSSRGIQARARCIPLRPRECAVHIRITRGYRVTQSFVAAVSHPDVTWRITRDRDRPFRRWLSRSRRWLLISPDYRQFSRFFADFLLRPPQFRKTRDVSLTYRGINRYYA